jgi:hypothetical protein
LGKAFNSEEGKNKWGRILIQSKLRDLEK